MAEQAINGVTTSNRSTRVLAVAGVLGALAVIAGAFAAHGLEGRLSPRMLDIWSTAVRYHMWHTLALLAVAASNGLNARRFVNAACLCWIAGVVLFSGSLYALCLTGVTALGAITPLGGVAFVAGWLLLALAAGWRSDAT